jgi:hypothetical protein
MVVYAVGVFLAFNGRWGLGLFVFGLVFSGTFTAVATEET